jgi:hypothetical protein
VICRICLTDKPDDEFYVRGDIARRRTECKPCLSGLKRRYNEQLVIVVPEEKMCRICKQTLPAASFFSSRGTKDGLYSYCKECSTKQHTKWCDANPGRQTEITRKSNLRRKYGLTPEEHIELQVSHEGRCAICRQVPVKGRHNAALHIDHDHKTGKVRGLLCARCNVSIGQFEDSPALLRSAAEYLEKHVG